MTFIKLIALSFISLGLHAVANGQQNLRRTDSHSSTNNQEDGTVIAKLNNGKVIPLVGMGVGNLPHNLIQDTITNGFADDKQVRLIDTAKASRNEQIIAESLHGLNFLIQQGITSGEKSLVRCGTSKGDFTMEFIQEWSPNGYARAVELFRKGFYDYSHFFRTIPDFLVQFGLSYSDDLELQDYAVHSIPDDPQLKPRIPFREGTISYAGSGPESRTSQLFIAYQARESFGKELWETPVGYVKEGFDVIQRLNGEYGDRPEQPKIRRYREAYIEKYFPNIDRFHKCSVETIEASDNQAGSGVEGVHVITKVWYTHLGYERTKLSIYESLRDLSSTTDVKVHLLLHWPRCDDNIIWMNCEEEESNLPQHVQELGSPPHLNPHIWMESWRAMEELYEKHGMIESIGVSNFEIGELKTLIQESRIRPQIYQGNVWKAIFDSDLMDLLNQQEIFFQAYGIMSGVIGNRSRAPNAFTVLKEVSELIQFEVNRVVTEGMIVASWLVQQGIGIIPRSSTHQDENSPIAISSIPKFTSDMNDLVSKAVSALLRGEDLQISVTFHNDRKEGGSVSVHWYDNESGEEFEVIDKIPPGSSFTIDSHPQHRFVVYDEWMQSRKEYIVSQFYGGREVFKVSDEL